MSLEKFLGLKIVLLRLDFPYDYPCDINKAILLWTVLHQLPTHVFCFLVIPRNMSPNFKGSFSFAFTINDRQKYSTSYLSDCYD